MCEVVEETGIDPVHVKPLTTFSDRHGNWRYDTVLATAVAELVARELNDESHEVRAEDRPLCEESSGAGAHPPSEQPRQRSRAATRGCCAASVKTEVKVELVQSSLTLSPRPPFASDRRGRIARSESAPSGC